jgi:hypothetical protein
VPIAGNNLQFEFGGDVWIARLNGRNLLAGTVTLQNTNEGVILSLTQTHTYPPDRVPGVGRISGIAGRITDSVGWIRASGPEIILEYRTGPSASLRSISRSEMATRLAQVTPSTAQAAPSVAQAAPSVAQTQTPPPSQAPQATAPPTQRPPAAAPPAQRPPAQRPPATARPAQRPSNSFAPGFENNWMLVNTGIGVGTSGGHSMGMPSISASMDFILSNAVPITLGLTFIYNTWKFTSGWSPSTIDVTYRNIGIGGRFLYHFNAARNLDTYIGITLGGVSQSAHVYYERGYAAAYRPEFSGESFFLFGANVGFRYFFTNSFGIYSELGYSRMQIFTAGLAFKI